MTHFKKTLITILFLLFSTTLFSQTNDSNQRLEISIGTDLFDYGGGPFGGMSVWIKY